MRKIKDERLIIQNLKNIRIAFLVQTVGILVILAYELIQNGAHAMFNQPLWLVLIITLTVLLWLQLRISVDVYENVHGNKKPGSYYRIILLSLGVGIVLALFTRFGPDQSSNIEALITGSVVFVCFLIPFTVVYYLRRKRAEDNDI